MPLVSAGELEKYADTIESEGVIPDVISRLIQVSVNDLAYFRVPRLEDVGLPDPDVIMESTAGALPYVPAGRSLWEIGTGVNPIRKAREDFQKRTKKVDPAEKARTTFVFASPRSAGWSLERQEEWLKECEGCGWREVRVLDGVQLAEWLRRYPAIGKHVLKKVRAGNSEFGFRLPSEYWHETCRSKSGDPPLPPELFLIARDSARAELQTLLEGKVSQMQVAAENARDLFDFVTAYLASLPAGQLCAYRDRCLLIDEMGAWRSMASQPAPHVLVGHPKLDLLDSGEQDLLTAKHANHPVIFTASATGDPKATSLVFLRSPSAAAIEKVLVDAKFSLARARELAAAGAYALPALVRRFHNLGDAPRWTNTSHGKELAQANLAGEWHGHNQADKAVLEDIVGKRYGEWIDCLRPETLRSDAPLIQRDEKWKVISRTEAWFALGHHLFDEDLERFSRSVIAALGENDPRLHLPPEERLAAEIRGEKFQHSTRLRRGLAETVALLGAKASALSSCSESTRSSSAIHIVRSLLKNAGWIRWASLNPLLPALAEAAPDEFLRQIEAELSRSPETFRTLFSHKSGGFGETDYVSGLTWALETLAWAPEHLIRVVAILGEFAAIDPGGNSLNRPAASIVGILLPWFPQTLAPLEKRKAAVQALLAENGDVGWKVLLGILPKHHGATTGTHKPAWRPFIPADHKDEVSFDDYRRQVEAYADIATVNASARLDRLTDLIDRLPDLPDSAYEKILAHLDSPAVAGMDEAERTQVWETLVDLAAKHRKFPDSAWAMEAAEADRIEATAARIAPLSASLLARRLFSDREIDLFSVKGNYDEQRQALREKRRQVLEGLYLAKGFDAVVAFARDVPSPNKVGDSLAALDLDTLDRDLLPSFLQTTDPALRAVVGSYLAWRYHLKSAAWIDRLPLDQWSKADRLAFFVQLPFERDAWLRAEANLGGIAREYWKQTPAHSWSPPTDTTEAIEKLLAVDRPRAALHCLCRFTEEDVEVPPELAIRVLLAAVSSSESTGIDHHNTREVIQALQKNPKTNPDGLFQVEWRYLAILENHSRGEPAFLVQQLATRPEFYLEILQAVFRSENAEKTAPTTSQKKIAENGYRLLQAWRKVPGTDALGGFDPAAFEAWLARTKQLTQDAGFFRIAMSQLGQVLVFSPPDPDGLWMHRAIAHALNGKDAAEMRSGFTTGLFNQRGTYSFTAGKEEREIAGGYRAKADAVENAGFSRLATSLRELTSQYERDADREEKRNPFEF